MLDLYDHLHDDDSQQAKFALAATGTETAAVGPAVVEGSDGSLRAIGQSAIEKLSQVPSRIGVAKRALYEAKSASLFHWSIGL